MGLRHVVVVVVWVLSLAVAVAWTHAQAPSWTPLTEPVVKAGDDVGFRIEWMHGRTPYGQLVIRHNGQWIDAHIGAPRDRQMIPPPPPPPPPFPPR